MQSSNDVDLQNLERIATHGVSSFGVLVSSLMQYNAFLLAAFAVIASTSRLCSSIIIAYIPIATASLLLPLLSAVLLHKALRRQADNEIKRLFQKHPDIFKEQSEKFKERYKKPTEQQANKHNTQWRIQEASVYASILHTVSICTIVVIQYA